MDLLDFNKELDRMMGQIQDIYTDIGVLLENPPENEDTFREEMEGYIKEANHRYIDLTSFAGAAHAQIFGKK